MVGLRLLVEGHVEQITPTLVVEVGDTRGQHRGAGPLVFHVDLAVFTQWGGSVFGSGVLTAVLSDQSRGTFGIVAFLHDVGVVVRALGNEHLVGQTTLTGVEQIEVTLTIGGQRESLANTHVVEGCLGGVDHQEVFLTAVVDAQGQAGVVAVGLELVRVGGVQDVEVTVEQQLGAGVGIGNRVELDCVEVHRAHDRGAPPVIVAHELRHRVLGAAVELERSGTNRLLLERRVGRQGVKPRR